MTGKEWSKEFENVNGRKPTSEEFQIAKDNDYSSIEIESLKHKNYLQIVKDIIKKTFKYSGRSNRTEFWIALIMFVVAARIALFVLQAIWTAQGNSYTIGSKTYFNNKDTMQHILSVIDIFIALPLLSTWARRMKDAGYNPLTFLIPIFSFVVGGFFDSKSNKKG